MKKNYYIFDLIKFILSLLVVQIHTGAFRSYNPSLDDVFKNLIGRYAVPLFFMISSYLLFDKIDKNDLFSKNNILIFKNYLKRLTKLYISWALIYFMCLKFIFNYTISLEYFLVNFFLIGFYRQFWFLVAQIWGTLIFLFLLKITNIKKIVLISFLLYIFGLILVPYNSISGNVFKFIPEYNDNVFLCRNALTFALIFISTGAYINLNKSNILKQKNIILLTLISALLSIVEFLFLKYIGCKYYAVQIFILSTSVFIFILFLKTNLIKKKIYIKLRKYSTLIFCLHTIIYLFLNKFFSFNNSLLIYLSTIFICIIISEIIIYINKKGINIKFLY